MMGHDILIITKNFYPDFGGVETYLTEFIKYCLKRTDSELFIIYPKKKAVLPDSITMHNIKIFIPVFSFDFINLDESPFVFFAMIQTMLYYCFILFEGAGLLFKKRKNITCIYGVGGPFSIFPSLILAKIFRKKCFGHIHADFLFARRSGLLKVFYRRLFNNLDRIFVNSMDVEIDLLNIGVNKSKIIIIANWVDTQIFKLEAKKAARDALNFPEDKKILLFVGRLSYEKGVNEVLDCIDFLKEDKRFLFVIIGDGPLKSKVEDRLKNNNNAIFLGPKRDFELVDYYNVADALLWGSIDTRYVSITIMEALCCGLPILAPRGTTNICKFGIKEFEVKDGVLPDFLGLLFKSSAKDLAEVIEKFSHLNFDRKRINQYAIEKYSDRNTAPIFEEFYSTR